MIKKTLIFIFITAIWIVSSIISAWADSEKLPVSIPQEIGKIEKIYTADSPSDLWVIQIQDAHCVMDAQKNISSLIRHLFKNYGLKYVYLEGGSGMLDLSRFNFHADRKTKMQIMEKYLKQGLVSGAEYAAVMNERNGFYLGIEDQKLYDRNRTLLLESEKSRPAREKILSDIYHQLKAASKNKSLNKKASLYSESIRKVALLLKASRLDIEKSELAEFVTLASDLQRDADRFIDLLGITAQSKDWVDLSTLFEPVIRFYEVVLKRDASISTNVLENLRKNQPELAVLVVGGFHSQGIGEILSKHGVNSIIVSPKIDSWQGRENYVDVIKKTYNLPPSSIGSS